MAQTLKIGLIGAECTGKSTLGQTLAEALQGVYVPEVLRAWCETRGRTPNAAEQSEIFAAQQAAEHAAVQSGAPIIVCDSTPLLTAIYSVHYFADESLTAAGVQHQRSYALTLLTLPDLPWVADGIQRESPEVRERVHALIARTLSQHGLSAHDIAGEGDDRLQRALRHVDALRQRYQSTVTDARSVRGAAGKR